MVLATGTDGNEVLDCEFELEAAVAVNNCDAT